MSYEITTPQNHGYNYTITVNGLTVHGWRLGNKHDVESYVSHIHATHVRRAKGEGKQFSTSRTRDHHKKGMARYKRMNGLTDKHKPL